MTYMHYCISETLRIDPSVTNSTAIELTENIKIGKYDLLSSSIIVININALHHNDNEWKEHNKFIPDRFDPKSEYYLTPVGTKRHPMSYGPFLGGKRICLGKTFAENIGKCIIPIIISQFDFEFTEKEMYLRKPGNSLVKVEPPYNVIVKFVA